MRFERVSPFYVDLRQRVAEHFKERGVSRTGGGPGLAYAIAILGGIAALHALAMSDLVGGWAFFAVQLGLGFLTYLVAVGIAHDASHGGLSRIPWVNRLFTRLFDFAAVSSFVWTFDHIRSHHAHSNVASYDNALENALLFRTHPDDPHHPWHRWQHLYAWPLYAGASLHRWFIHDWARVLRRRSGRVEVPSMSLGEWVWFVFGIASRNSLFLLGPILLTSVPAWQVIAGFIVMHMLVSALLIVAVQITHQSEGTEFYPESVGALGLDIPWDLAIVRATTDFAPNSKLVTLLCGGLNLHTVHHLFPKVHHRHLIEVNRIMVECAVDHGIPTTQRSGVWAQVAAHHRYLRDLGNPTLSSTATPAQRSAALSA